MKWLLIIGLSLVNLISAPLVASQETPQFIVHILGYVRKDYSVAVQNGKVLSAPEYQEQLDFVASALETAKALGSLNQDSATIQGLQKLQSLVLAKADSQEIGDLTLEIEKRVIELGGIEVAPLRWPDRLHGQALYQKNCTACHGVNGHGDGPSGTHLEPKPSNFHDSAMNDVSPFQFFNTIRLGVPGTGMAAYGNFSDKEVWDLAFYLASVRHEALGIKSQKTLPEGVTLAEVAKSSDAELTKRLGNQVAAIRMYQAEEASANAAIQLGREKLNQAMDALRAGDRSSAQHLAVLAYLEGVEPIEPALRSRNAALTIELEGAMADIRSAISAGHDAESVKVRVLAAHEVLAKAETVLSQKQLSAGLTFWLAAGIFTREAFESVLIIVTLLGVIRSIGSQKAAYFVHGGWLLAVAIGVITWFFSGWLMAMSGAQRELMEGMIALLAVVVLLYLGFWLHRRSEIGKWRAFIDEMVNTAVSGNKLLILGGVSFMAVFREAFEVVLFLRALLLEAGTSQSMAVLGGVLSSFVVVLVLAALLVKFSVRLPLRQLFSISSVVMVLLAVVLTGKAVRSFQEVGWLSITNFPWDVRIDLLGVYPTYESLLPQLVVVATSFLLLAWGKRAVRLAQQPA